MPLLPEEAVVAEGPVGAAPAPAAPRPRPAALDTLAAAFRQSNVVSSAYDVLANGGPRPAGVVGGYDPFNDIAGYEDHADRFIESDSPEETAWIKQRIQSELRDKQVLADAGGWGLTASIAAGATDPTTLLAMAIPGGGATRLANAGRQVAAQLVLDTGSEALLQATQETRTVRESLINVGAGAVLTGLLGAAITPRVPPKELERARRSLADWIAPPTDSTVGAAAVRGTTAADETIATGGDLLDRTLGKFSPGARVLTSPSVEARRLVQDLTETPEILAKNLNGVATPTAIETLLKRTQGTWWQAYRARGLLYRDYAKRVREAGEPVLSRAQFGEEIAFAMRRGDQSVIPEVAQAAAEYRRLVYEPWKQRAVKLGLLSEDVAVTGADSYLMRQYNVARIRREQSAWLETLTEGFQKQGMERAEALDVAHQVTRTVLGSERGTLDTKALDEVVGKSGRLKERTIRLPDEVLEPWLVNDIDALSMAYLRTLAPEVEITTRFGDRDLKDALDKVKQEYGILKSKAAAAGDDAELAKLIKREESDLRDLSAIRDRLYGHFGAPKDPGSFFVRAGRLVRAVNYTRLLGGQVVSAMTDVARLTIQYGAPRMMASALQLATSVKAIGLARAEARRMAIGLDLVLNTRGIALGDIGEYSTFAEQAVARRVSDIFSVASLQSPWNAVMKSWASVMSQHDVLSAARKVAEGRTLSKRDVARLAAGGLDESMLRRIAREAEEHGIDEQGLRFGNSDQWKDQAAAQAYEAAILREADLAILTPSAGDLPLFYSTEWGKALLQFKSFALSSVRRLQVPIAQGVALGDLKTMTGIPAMLGLGALVYVLKQRAADQPIEENPARFAMEMVDKSGLLAWSGDVIFPSLWQLGSDDYSRWSDRQPVETLLGPVAGTVADAYTSRWPARVMDGEMSPQDIHKLRRLVPGQNLWYARRGINWLEEQAAQ